MKTTPKIHYKKAVTFSYDDGISQDKRLVEIFNKYGMKCTFNLNTGIQTSKNTFEIEGVHISRMDQEGLDELYKGHEIASHGLTHSGLNGLSREELEKEFLTDAQNIERLYGKYPVGMAYAYGDHPQEAVDYLESIGIRYGRTVESTHGFELPDNPLLLNPTCHHNDEKLFELAEEFLQLEGSEENPRLFYIWGHSYEFTVNNNWERIEKLCQMLSGRDDIFYGTNAECLL
ncbi:MAG: polysaccharide deacetylase family protein [Lachnospiraceae bacterium]|nr:polysaccharide deacetylase family protein [Lachnospiraceae bacterium]